MLIDRTYVCGSCGESVVIGVDPSAGSRQEYVEDCPVCCCPHVLSVSVRGEEVEVRAALEG